MQEAKLNTAQADLNAAQATLDEKQAELDEVQAMYDAAMKEKQVGEMSSFVMGSILTQATDNHNE